MPVLIQDRKHRLLSGRVVGLPQTRWELEARLPGPVERDMADQVLHTQSELAVG